MPARRERRNSGRSRLSRRGVRTTVRDVLQALAGFGTIWTVIAVGWLLAHLKVAGHTAQRTLNHLAFVAASPALLFQLVAKGSLDHLLSRTLIASFIAIALTAGAYLLVNRLWFRHGTGPATIGTLAAAYTNAGNLGLPVAQHVLGDMTWMAPILLLQIGLMQPAALVTLDIAQARTEGRELSKLNYLTMPFRNPITVGILLGLAVNLTRLHLPQWLDAGVTMVGNMAVPGMLIAFGISLRLDPLPGTGPGAREVWTIEALKLLWMPAVAVGVALLLGLPRHDLLAVAVIAALPTAQNIFVIGSRYSVAAQVARDSIFWSTILCVPVIVALAGLLG